MKLPLREAEHTALRVELSRWDGYVSSTLLAVESIRACARYGAEYAGLARSWLTGMALLPLDNAVLDEATALAPDGLRSLDSLHLATALSVREDIGAFVVYDERLAEAGRRHDLPVVTPS